jgi:hypothetical protein
MFLPIAYLAVSQNATPPPDLRIVVRADAPLLSLSRTLTHAITEAAPGAAVSYSVVTNPDLAMMLARACNHCLPLSGPLDYRQEDV